MRTITIVYDFETPGEIKCRHLLFSGTLVVGEKKKDRYSISCLIIQLLVKLNKEIEMLLDKVTGFKCPFCSND